MQIKEMAEEIGKIGLTLNEFAFFRNGEIKSFRFRPGDHCSNCYSIAKAFTMTAVGMLWDEGLIDVRKPVADYMKDLIPPDADPRWQSVTVENALTHRIGFGEGFLDIDVENVLEYPTDDYLDIVFRHPLRYAPGEQYQYSDAAFYLLSRLVSRITHEKLDDFLNGRLMQPLRFHEAAWSRCPHNYPMGATGLYVSAADLVKLPALYMHDGIWEGRRLISEQWIRTAEEREYELHPYAPSGWTGKGGMYGQMMLYNTSGDTAVAWLGHTTDKARLQKLVDLLDDLF